jgi:hypothetical protein
MRGVKILDQRALAQPAYGGCQSTLVQQDWGRRDNIEDELESGRQAFERDQVELSDSELNILSKLTAAGKIPFNPEKRVYKYLLSHIPHPLA